MQNVFMSKMDASQMLEAMASHKLPLRKSMAENEGSLFVAETVTASAHSINEKCAAFMAQISPWTTLCRWLMQPAASPNVIHLNPDNIMVPGLAGVYGSHHLDINSTCTINSPHCVAHLDAHAHIIENGFIMNLPLKDTASAQGEPFVCVV